MNSHTYTQTQTHQIKRTMLLAVRVGLKTAFAYISFEWYVFTSNMHYHQVKESEKESCSMFWSQIDAFVLLLHGMFNAVRTK